MFSFDYIAKADIKEHNPKWPFNFDYITKEDITEHNTKWPEVPDDSYHVLIMVGCRSGKKIFIC